MSEIKNIANRFLEVCETGQGWQACKNYCLEDASFSSHAEALLEVKTIEEYSDWMTRVCSMMPDSNYDVKSLTIEEEKGHVSIFAVFSGTHTGEGGPIPPTGKSGEVDYVYIMEFLDNKIKHLTKVWNPHHFFKQIGWE